MILELERSFGDTNGSRSALNDVLFRRLVSLSKQAVQIWEEVGQTVDECKHTRQRKDEKVQGLLLRQSSFVPSRIGFLNGLVPPERLERFIIRSWERLIGLSIVGIDDRLDMGQVFLCNFEAHVFHGLQHISHACRQVVENKLSIVLNLFGRKRNSVDESHLL